MDPTTPKLVRQESEPLSASRGWWRHAWAPTLFVVWAIFVQLSFLGNSGSLVSGVTTTFSTWGLALLSTLSFLMLGWRARRLLSWFDEGSGESGDWIERTLVELALGVSCVMLLMFVVGVLGMLLPEVAVAVVVLPLVGGPSFYREALADFRHRWRSRGAVGRPLLPWAMVGVVGVLTLLESLTPARSQDAIVYHLAVPARYIAEGSIHHVPGNFYASFPQNVDMLFTLGLLLQGDVLAKFFHWMLGAAATGAVVCLARGISGAREEPATERSSAASRTTPSALAAATFATIPTAALISTWAYIDLGVVFFSVMSLVLFVRFWRQQNGVEVPGLRHRSTLALGLSAFFAGVTAGCKYTGAAQIIFVVLGVAALGVTEKRSFRVTAKLVLFAGLLASLVVAPWLIKNVVLTGNPLHPFAYSIFGGRDWDSTRASILSYSLGEWGGTRSSWDLMRLPWDLTVFGEFFSLARFDGVIGGAFLIGAPLILVGLRGSGEYRLVAIFGLLNCLTWVATTHQVRFLLPALAVASALFASAVAGLQRESHRRLASGVLCAAILANVVIVANHFSAHNPLPVLLGRETRHEFLARELPGGDYQVFRFIDENLPEESRILFGSCGNPGYLCKRDYHSDALFENFTLVRLLDGCAEPEDLLERLKDRGFTHLLFRLPLVFDPQGRRSEIPQEGQGVLLRFLNRHATLLITASDTCLFRIDEPSVTAAVGSR